MNNLRLLRSILYNINWMIWFFTFFIRCNGWQMFFLNYWKWLRLKFVVSNSVINWPNFRNNLRNSWSFYIFWMRMITFVYIYRKIFWMNWKSSFIWNSWLRWLYLFLWNCNFFRNMTIFLALIAIFIHWVSRRSWLRASLIIININPR